MLGTRKLTKLEINTRKRLAEITKAAAPGQLQTPEGRKEVFKKFTTHNDPATVAAKIRIIQQNAAPIPVMPLSQYRDAK